MSSSSDPGLSEFFHTLCDAAAEQTLPMFRSGLGVSNKLDGEFDPVTEADRQAELAIRSLIEERFPDHGIIGEEFGRVRKEARHQWIIDPIDGTRAFISGLPVWGTLIGLYEDGVPVAGVMDQPFTKERYISVDGNSSLLTGSSAATKLQTSAIASIAQSTLMTTSPHLLMGEEDKSYFEVEKSVKLFRYGCDCYAYCLLAAGQIDLVIEAGLNIYDIAALIPIIEGAGGIVTNWQGENASQGGSVLAAANKDLHAQALALL
ncbi:MAG: histidinol-phosphatase [Rhizobiaceae bacterium]